MTTFKIAGVDAVEAQKRDRRMSMLLWGPSGSGKTTFACTAPGQKLVLNFDPDGDASVAYRDDVTVIDLSGSKPNIVELFKNPNNPLDLQNAMEHVDTVIFDSLTTAGEKALQHAVTISKNSTMELPGIPAYSARNMYILQAVSNILALTAKYNKHVIFIAHEGPPVTNDDGILQHITLSLSGDMPERAAIRFSEVWNLTDTGKERRLMIRPARSRKPAKSRMFDTTQAPEFVLTYDADKNKGMTIAQWYSTWVDGGLRKLSIPK
jgi:hypothetical protein